MYRARLGAVFGRGSGLPRYVVLEVVDRPSPDCCVVVAGFGRRAQWLRNVEASPHVRVHLGSHAPVAAVARRLDPDATTASLGRYAEAHPRSRAKIRPVLEKTLGTQIDERAHRAVAVPEHGDRGSLTR
ncbi:nitroreductase family deazaflavin-dependent oxidoreductase [Rhodococcus antarcticus]|uniref:Nitroreductase family deazaflavin-dependent oxidoreductase n=1 Tax=Rhodococcus antarcticus TaxID=2987751 RepID=A0ABY6P2V8_9NOCA|nr:nitroreductase family deazaflavin-dependent oxidoreductase [Rhodococcus antarcticus]UZJ25478.1 nitroreductase family deazaflavin-dependent oxidoreductase [Rhodococcus antarcticus]